MRQVSLLALAAVIAISAPSLAQSPPIFVPQPPPLSPPPPPSPPSSERMRAPVFVSTPMPPRKLRTLEVRVTAAGRTLIADRLRIRDGQMASVSTNRTEASVIECKSLWQNSQATGINLSIYGQRSDDEQTYRLSFSWSRPGPDIDGCESGGTQRVSIEQNISFAKSPRVVIRGDADTVVELRLVGEAS